MNKTFAYAEYRTIEDATRTLEAINQKVINGRVLSVEYSLSSIKNKSGSSRGRHDRDHDRYDSRHEPPRYDPRYEPPRYDPRYDPPRYDPRYEPPRYDPRYDPPRYDPRYDSRDRYYLGARPDSRDRYIGGPPPPGYIIPIAGRDDKRRSRNSRSRSRSQHRGRERGRSTSHSSI